MPTTILDDVLLALEETAAENFHNDRCGLLLAAHNRLVCLAEEAKDAAWLQDRPPVKSVLLNAAQLKKFMETPVRFPTEIDNREDPEE